MLIILLSKLNIEKSVFDNYKYNIYDNLFKKLTSIEYKLQDNKIQKKADKNYRKNRKKNGG